jgi:hypothetical protein
MLPRQAHPINKRPIIDRHLRNLRLRDRVDAKVALGQNDDVGPRNLKRPQRLADNLFGSAVAVGVGGVPGIDAALVGVLE